MTPANLAGSDVAAEVTPRCRHFGVCGGCQLQHLSAPTQLERKRDAVRERLSAAGVQTPRMETHAAQPYAYRNRIRLRLQEGRVGYSMRASNEFVAVTECPIAMDALWAAAQALKETAADAALLPRHSVEVEFFTDGDGVALQMLLHLEATVQTLERDAPAQFRALCKALQARVPQLAGAGLLVKGELVTRSRRVQERQRVEVAGWGEPHLMYTVAEQRHAVSRGAFFQVNRFLTERMVQLAVGARSGRAAWDLFAGAGLFSLPLSRRFQQVTAVEVGQPAASDLALALAAQGPQHRAVAQPVQDFLRRTAILVPDLIVMDPPRAGLGVPLVQQLVRIAAPELVYVSCDAGSFARDARALVDSRYAVEELHLLDLFPQTDHTETIAVFRRSA